MKGITKPGKNVSGTDGGSAIEAKTPRASTGERTIVIVLAQLVVIAALIVIWSTLRSRRAEG